MHLSEYLSKHGERTRFAKAVGMSESAVTYLCTDKRWPRREVWERIFVATSGQVTPNDHLTSVREGTASGENPTTTPTA